jgi:hypothetical protein
MQSSQAMCPSQPSAVTFFSMKRVEQRVAAVFVLSLISVLD